MEAADPRCLDCGHSRLPTSYLWLTDVPANLRPTDRRFIAVWQDEKTILYSVSNVGPASDTKPALPLVAAKPAS